MNLLVSDFVFPVSHKGKGPTNIVEGTASGWRDLEEAWVNERSEGGRRLVFLHVVARLALQADRVRFSGDRISQL